MTSLAKSAATLLTLCALVLLGGWWGWSALTKPLPSDESAPLCTDVTATAGTQIYSRQVAVSVYNASNRSGLANATMEQLEERGFVAADSGNAPAAIKGVQIWSDEPRNAAVQLVKRQFKKAKVVSGKQLGRGVVVVVGQDFKALRTKETQSLTAGEDSTFCSPPASQ